MFIITLVSSILLMFFLVFLVLKKPERLWSIRIIGFIGGYSFVTSIIQLLN